MRKLVLASPFNLLNLSLLQECTSDYEILFLDRISDLNQLPNETDFLLPTNESLELVSDMRPFSPINFGSLWLALKRRKTQKIPSDFIVALRNSPAVGYTQRLHFYNVNGVDQKSLYQNIYKSLQSRTETMARPWSENLLPYIEGRSFSDIVLNTDELVIVQDGFPKSKHHFLCIPKRRIDSWEFLTVHDVPLLQNMLKVSQEFSRQFNAEFQFGFHVIPSMRQLHLHIISKDFDSPTFETTAQWQAFNTEFLVTVPSVIAELEAHGRIVLHEGRRSRYWDLLFDPVKCTICQKADFDSFAAFKAHYVREYRSNLRNNSYRQ